MGLVFCLSFHSHANDFSSRENFNKLLKGFYKNEIFKCNYINKSWSTGFEQYHMEWLQIVVHLKIYWF